MFCLSGALFSCKYILYIYCDPLYVYIYIYVFLATQVPYEVEVMEDAALGTTVFSGIRVEDRDTVGDNLNVSCSVSANQMTATTDVDACSK